MTEHLDETTAAQLLAGELAADAAERARAHVTACRDCEQFVAELARVEVTADTAPSAPPAGELRRGTTVGRFIVIGRIGAGGMGVVHQAYDPELDRRVALKLLRSSRADDDVRARLLREAQAAARLAHPNVVSVFDIGVYEDGVYLAMEYVDGQTLSAWLRGNHAWEDIVGVFVQAGRGIAAAHEAGVIHRDFKPDNVLIGRDGRARVVDFGLARGADSPAEAVAPAAVLDETPPGARSLSDRLTRTGALLGTPRYMAPEQFTGGEITPATDQFAFCVALYQALYRRAPFDGNHITEIASSVLAGDIAQPATPRGPQRLRRAVVRGLAVDPAQRWPTLPALLRELEAVRGVRRRWTVAAIGALAALVVGAGAFVVASRMRESGASCSAAADKLPAAWNADRKARVHAAFARHTLPYGELAFRGVAERLDAYAADWTAMREEACAATHVHHEQSAQLLDLRVACLDERLAALGALAAALEAADADTVRAAVNAADALPALARCADRAALLAQVPPPDPAIAARVAVVNDQLSRADALDRLGKYAPALAAVTTACAGAEGIAYRPLLARCRLIAGELTDNGTGDHERAAKLLADAEADALATNDPGRASEAAVSMGHVLALQDRYDEVERWIAIADGVGARLAERGDLDAKLAELRGTVALGRGHPAEALPHFERFVAIRERLDPKAGLSVARARITVAHTLTALGHYDQAAQHYQRSLAVIEEVSGKQHPELNPVLEGLGEIAWAQGHPREAIPYFERSLAITRATVPAGHPGLVTSLANAGAVYADSGDDERALAVLEEALRTVPESGRRERGLILTNLVDVYQRRGDHARALATAQEALAIERAFKGDEHADTARAHFNVGDELLSLGRSADAAAEFRTALAIWERTLPADHRYFAIGRAALGDALLRGGDARAAIAPLEAAQSDPRARFLLAEALWTTGRDRARARTLAQTTAEALRKDPAPDRKLLSDIEKWLSTR